GYKPIRSLIAYVLVILGFAITYFILGNIVGPQLSPLESLVFSLTSFHGRGFFPGGIRLDDPLTVVSALEAVVGLTIEISFIATFTQRFFGK
ncbi:MAG TPA: pentapeptide repeat-containing protein, partial [Ktedonobacteraceae bacterium]|nr:pentapeptide repeat-containing protein [Ktedonobacteraceae bacterium]